MYPQKLKMVILCGISMISTMSFANGIETEKDGINIKDNRNGDSVMTPGTMVKPALGTVNKKQGNSNSYTPNQEIEYSSASCPAGYSNGGSSSFRTGQRLITSFYSNGQLMKTTTGNWMTVNESCAGTENQTVSCPSGYMGTVQQKRTVTYNTSGYNYGNWSDISNSCVIIPPVTPPAPVSCPIPDGPLIGEFQNYDSAIDCTYEVTYYTIKNNICVANPPEREYTTNTSRCPDRYNDYPVVTPPLPTSCPGPKGPNIGGYQYGSDYLCNYDATYYVLENNQCKAVHIGNVDINNNWGCYQDLESFPQDVKDEALRPYMP